MKQTFGWGLLLGFALHAACGEKPATADDHEAGNLSSGELEDLLARVQALEDEQAKLRAVLRVNGAGDVVIEGANLYVQNGEGTTDTLNSKGNLILGYDLDDPADGFEVRQGSHNLVIGDEHTYAGYGGIITGHDNETLGAYSTVIASSGSDSDGSYSIVVGGQQHEADADYSTILGGQQHVTSGEGATTVGGELLTAEGSWALSAGGSNSNAKASYSAVFGGGGHKANGYKSTIVGGNANTAMNGGDYESIFGGQENTADNDYSTTLGGYQNGADGAWATTTGGQGNTTSTDYGTSP